VPPDSDRTGERHVSSDRDTIRSWADEHGAVPVREGATGGGDRVRIVPEANVAEDHERVEWEAFFTELESGEQVVVYHAETTDEPLQVTGRDEVIAEVDEEDAEERLLQGETVTSEITETSVVESVVVEEYTVESELVDSDVLDQRSVDVEFLGREATVCDLVETEGVDVREQFDAEGYLAQLDAAGTAGDVTAGGRTADDRNADDSTAAGRTADDRTMDDRTMDDRTMDDRTMDDRAETTRFEADESFPYHVEADVEETWSVVRELVEEFTIESRIRDAEVTEADSLEDHDVDVDGLHRSIVEEELVQTESTPEEALTQYDMESELAESDRVRTTLTRERTVEDEVLDRKRVEATVTGGEIQEVRRLDTTPLAGGFEEETATTPAAEATEGGATTDAAAAGVDLTDDVQGKTVVNAAGEEIGLVSDVEPDRGRLYVDVEPGITERIMSALGWGDADEDDSPLPASAIDRVADDEVVLKRSEHLSDDGGEDRV